MHDNPMSANRPLSVRSKPSVSPPVELSVSPTRSPLTSLFPSDENLVNQSHEAAESVVSAPAAHAISGAQDRSDDGGSVQMERRPLSQGVSGGATELSSVWRSVEAQDHEEPLTVAQKTESEQPFDNPPVVIQSTKKERESEIVIPNVAVSPFSPTPSPSADRERRTSANALARASIRTSPIPLDSIPSVSPIRFQRTRRAPREPAATPFESSFQASDFSDEHEHVVIAVAAGTSTLPATVNMSIEAQAESGLKIEEKGLSTADERVFFAEKDVDSAEQKIEALSVSSEAHGIKFVEPHASGGLHKEYLAVDAISISSKDEEQLVQEKSKPQAVVPSQSVPVFSAKTAVDESHVVPPLPATIVAVRAQSIVNAIDTVEASSEGTVEKRPVFSRPRFQPMPRRSSIASKPPNNPADVTGESVRREETGSIVTDVATTAKIADGVSSVRPPSPPSFPSRDDSAVSVSVVESTIVADAKCGSPAAPVVKRHRSVSFEQDSMATESSAEATDHQTNVVAAASPPLPSSSPPPTEVIVPTVLALDTADQVLPALSQVDIVFDDTVSKVEAETKVETAEFAEEDVSSSTDDESTIPAPKFSPPTKHADASEPASPVDEFLAPSMEPMDPPLSSPESVQPHHRFSLSKTRFPQFLQQRLDDDLSSDDASDKEREFEDFSFSPRESRAESMAEEFEDDDEFAETSNLKFNDEGSEEEIEDGLSDAASAAGTTRDPFDFSRKAATEGEIAAVKVNITQDDRPHETDTLPPLLPHAKETLNAADTAATEENFQPATVHRSSTQTVSPVLVVPSSPSDLSQVRKDRQHTSSEDVSSVSSLNPDMNRNSAHSEGMYAQLAHATSPGRHELLFSSAHTSGPLSIPPSSTDSAPLLNHAKNNDDICVLKHREQENSNIRTFSTDDMAEKGIDEGEEVAPFDETTLQETASPNSSLLSNTPPPQPAMSVPAGMYGQLAHASSPVRPVSVPITVSSSSGAGAASAAESPATATKPLKTSRWSWLKKKST